MMQSGYSDNIGVARSGSGDAAGDDDDVFGVNPFRSSTTTTAGAVQQQPHNVMMDQPLNRPDPMSGMTGPFDMPPPSPIQLNQQQQQHPQQQEYMRHQQQMQQMQNQMNQPSQMQQMQMQQAGQQMPPGPPQINRINQQMQPQQQQQPQPNQQQMQMQQQPSQGFETGSYLSGPMDQNATSTAYGGTGSTASVNDWNRGGGGNNGGAPSGGLGMLWNCCTQCLRLDTYVKYFDVDTTDVSRRFVGSLTTFYQPDVFRISIVGDDSASSQGDGGMNGMDVDNNAGGGGGEQGGAPSGNFKGPDLYGPFWICATLIFFIAAASNLHDYMIHRQHVSASHHGSSSSAGGGGSDGGGGGNDDAEPYDDGSGGDDSNGTDLLLLRLLSSSSAEQQALEEEETFEYDMNHLLHASTVVCFFAVLVPTAMYFVTAFCLAMPNIKLVMWLCHYGYAQEPYLLACLIVWIPAELLQWIVLLVASACSCMLIVRNLSTPLLSQDSASHNKATPIIMSILGMHVVYYFVLKIRFFK